MLPRPFSIWLPEHVRGPHVSLLPAPYRTCCAWLYHQYSDGAGAACIIHAHAIDACAEVMNRKECASLHVVRGVGMTSTTRIIKPCGHLPLHDTCWHLSESTSVI